MEAADRLAAYLAGELDTAQSAALEAEIARDATLRAEVAAMRRADEALAQLSSPALPDGFETRLQDRLRPVVAEQLGTSDAADDVEDVQRVGTFDDLAERRAARDAGRRLRWAPALGGVAAAAVAVMVMVNLGSDGLLPTAGDDAADGAADYDTDDAAGAEMFSDEAADEEMAEPLPAGPAVVVSGRQFDEDLLGDLRYAQDLDAVAGQGLDEPQGSDVAASWQAALGVEPVLSAAPESEAADDADSAEDAPVADEDTAFELRADVDPAPLRESGAELDDGDRLDLRRCLEEIITPGVDAIPAYVEFGSFDGEEVIVYGLVGVAPDTGAFTRPEIWVASRETCEIRYFSQD